MPTKSIGAELEARHTAARSARAQSIKALKERARKHHETFSTNKRAMTHLELPTTDSLEDRADLVSDIVAIAQEISLPSIDHLHEINELLDAFLEKAEALELPKLEKLHQLGRHLDRLNEKAAALRKNLEAVSEAAQMPGLDGRNRDTRPPDDPH